MATNPSDITNMLNEVMGAMNKLSTSQMASVQKLNDAQENASEKSRKLSRVIQTTVQQFDLFENIKEKKEKKKNDPVDKLLKMTTDLLKKTNITKPEKKVTKAKDVITPVTIENSNINVRGNLIMNSKSLPKILGLGTEKKSQSLENFDMAEQDPILLEELKLLKSIETKLGTPGGTGGGLFDALFGGLGNLIKMFTGGAAGEVGGLMAGMFGLNKFAKLKNLLNPIKAIQKSLPKIASAGKLLKNPKMLIPALVIGGAGAIWSGMKMYEGGVFTKPLDQIGNPEELNAEQREKGGSVYSGKPYIVGEKGPELFTPRETGKIVPNNQLRSQREDDTATSILELFKDYSKSSNKVFDYFVDKVNNVLDFIKPSNILDMVRKLLGKAADKVGDVIDKTKEAAATAVTNVFNFGKENVNKVTNVLGMGDVFNIPASESSETSKVPQPQISEPSISNIPRSYRIGSYSVPSDGPSKVHKDEMIIPAAQAELVRTAAKLQNSQVSIPRTPEVVSNSQLPKEFWMEEFVPKFASMIKTKKTNERIKEYTIGNVFGAA